MSVYRKRVDTELTRIDCTFPDPLYCLVGFDVAGPGKGRAPAARSPNVSTVTYTEAETSAALQTRIRVLPCRGSRNNAAARSEDCAVPRSPVEKPSADPRPRDKHSPVATIKRGKSEDSSPEEARVSSRFKTSRISSSRKDSTRYQMYSGCAEMKPKKKSPSPIRLATSRPRSRATAARDYCTMHPARIVISRKPPLSSARKAPSTTVEYCSAKSRLDGPGRVSSSNCGIDTIGEQEGISNKPNVTLHMESAFRNRDLAESEAQTKEKKRKKLNKSVITKKVSLERKYATSALGQRPVAQKRKSMLGFEAYTRCSNKLKKALEEKESVSPEPRYATTAGKRARTGNKSVGGINIFAKCAYIIHTTANNS